MAAGTLARLHRSPDVRRALRRGSRRRGRHVVLHALDRADGGPTRLAVVATRRVGGAVDRNRAKRVLREAARGLGVPAGYDLAVVARQSAARVSMDDVRDDLVTVTEQMFG